MTQYTEIRISRPWVIVPRALGFIFENALLTDLDSIKLNLRPKYLGKIESRTGKKISCTV
jgi:hypothetical protein